MRYAPSPAYYLYDPLSIFISDLGYAPWPVYATVLGVVGLVALIIWAKWGACCSRKRPEPVAAERLTSVSNYERLLSTKYLSRNDSYALEVLSEHASSFERYHVTYKLLSITTLVCVTCRV